jgi:hypothetical protein
MAEYGPMRRLSEGGSLELICGQAWRHKMNLPNGVTISEKNVCPFAQRNQWCSVVIEGIDWDIDLGINSHQQSAENDLASARARKARVGDIHTRHNRIMTPLPLSFLAIQPLSNKP